uniref:Uncharacterized protein n=1 Tax=Parascaris equorum TaxID=6256 RepID=A0A914R642_PAREQ
MASASNLKSRRPTVLRSLLSLAFVMTRSISQLESEKNCELFATNIAYIAKDIEILIDSLPIDEPSGSSFNHAIHIFIFSDSYRISTPTYLQLYSSITSFSLQNLRCFAIVGISLSKYLSSF